MLTPTVFTGRAIWMDYRPKIVTIVLQIGMGRNQTFVRRPFVRRHVVTIRSYGPLYAVICMVAMNCDPLPGIKKLSNAGFAAIVSES